MEMMACPHCGAQNSTKREYCYQCEGALRGEPKTQTKAPAEYVPTCANCAQASIFPPPGHRLAPSQVWCLQREEAVASDRVGGECFTEAFRWQREDILD